jgi:hypothetical protein
MFGLLIKKYMRKFKYIGNQKEAYGFAYPVPIIGKVYNENDTISLATALYYATNTHPTLAMEWEEVFDSTPFEKQVNSVLSNIKHLLLSKNEKYGNSALDPVRIFSKRGKTDQLLSRIDDKLSRIKNMGTDTQVDEDTVNDLIGYLILLKISKL